jgi:serine/threonine protein kinase
MIREATDAGDPIEIPLTFGPYTYVRTIGTGASSVVILARDSTTGENSACKVISRKSLEDERMMEQFVHALDIFQTHHHAHIIGFREVLYTEQNVFLIMEYCERGELISLVGDFETLPLTARYRIFSQILAALAYLHENGVAHRDLKPDNVMLDGQLNAKLADFGFSRRVDGNILMTTPCGSSTYVAPEIILGQEYDGFKSDIWSLGVVLFVLETGCYPWTATNNAQLFYQITHASYSVPSSSSADFRELMEMCLQVDPEKRPSANDLASICASRAGRPTPLPLTRIGPRAKTVRISKPSGVLYHESMARSAIYRQQLSRAGIRQDEEVSVLPILAPSQTTIVKPVIRNELTARTIIAGRQRALRPSRW